MTIEATPKLRCFVAIPGSEAFRELIRTVRSAAEEVGFRVTSFPEPRSGSGIMRTALGELAQADCVVADLTGASPNVYREMGIAQAMGKALLVLVREPVAADLRLDVQDVPLLTYEATGRGLKQLRVRLVEELSEFRRFPRPRRRFAPPYATPFFVDWDLLGQSEAENLCLELLAQMGYRRLEWEKELGEFDLVAELPKKDPDGFEYRELWLVAMGRNAPPEVVLDMLAHAPEFALRRLVRGPERLRRPVPGGHSDVPITVLLILLKQPAEQLGLFETAERVQRARMRMGPSPMSLRVRIWDRDHLTSLVQQFPQIGFKYFSEEGRSRSKYRKTPEELYKENVELANRLAGAVADLEEEKNRRVRAERDAVWKDISFSAAHKIGNPVFAIETNLDPLHRRIKEGRIHEALRVADSIRVSVEKAKGIVDQFKSLTRAQEITPVATLLRPLIDDACQTARSQGVICELDCAPEVTVHGDPERLSECFDELASNALHWFSKADRRITVHVSVPETGSVPSFLDSSRRYVLVHFRDNGPGVAVENKSRIFDAFFTTQEHGTGLGLALVRRIIEGHGGAITERGVPGQGADFEIHLPLVANGSGPAPTERPALSNRKET